MKTKLSNDMKTFLECIGEAAREPRDKGFMNWLIFKLDEEQLEHLARAAAIYAEQSNSHKPVSVMCNYSHNKRLPAELRLPKNQKFTVNLPDFYFPAFSSGTIADVSFFRNLELC